MVKYRFSQGMKYRVLLRILHALVYVKRSFWWVGTGFYFVFGKLFGSTARFFIYLRYKTGYFFRKLGLHQTRDWLFKRNFLQMALFVMVGLISLSQTRLSTQKDIARAAETTGAYDLLGGDQDYELEEVVSDNRSVQIEQPEWRIGTINASLAGGSMLPIQNLEFGTVVAGGTALISPIIISGGSRGSTRNQVVEYIIEPGDSLGAVAYAFGVSIPTVMWENKLSLRSIIKPGDILKVPPTTGVMHTIKKGDTLQKLAKTYDALVPDIIRFNHLKEDGTDLQIGERIMVPNGVQPVLKVAAPRPRTTPTINTLARQVATPPGSAASPSAAGFVWPSGSHTITQYYTLRHRALDIAGPWQTPTYAAKAGVVEAAQCGWNSGYGCYIIIDHGNGVKTLYGHHSQILVSAGDQVETGQTIGLMGNTGNVRGVTGIHVHFEVQRNGVRVNPLGYIR